MDFGMMTGAYGARFSPYDYHTNGMMQGAAQGRDDAARSDGEENPLSPEDPRDAQRDEQGDATRDLRLKDDKDLTPEEERAKASGHRSTPEECETCKRRKYQDGSDEMVSFKEHVSNAYQKAKDNNGEVVRANVRLKTAVCPEGGRTYISGGETTTQIRYFNEDNPYQQDMKESDADNKYRGANVDVPA